MIKKTGLAFCAILLMHVAVRAQGVDVVDLARVGTLGWIQREISASKKNVNRWDKDGNTPLIAAARWNPDKDVLNYLVSSGARIDAQNRRGETALIAAARYNPNPKAVLTLTRRGADVDKQDDTGRTALIWAVLENVNPEEVVRLLKTAGADEKIRDKSGKTAWDYAKKSGDRERIERLRPYLAKKPLQSG